MARGGNRRGAGHRLAPNSTQDDAMDAGASLAAEKKEARRLKRNESLQR